MYFYSCDFFKDEANNEISTMLEMMLDALEIPWKNNFDEDLAQILTNKMKSIKISFFIEFLAAILFDETPLVNICSIFNNPKSKWIRNMTTDNVLYPSL